MKAARAEVPKCDLGDFTGEELREWLVPRIGEPHHNNAHGALVAQLVKGGIIERTGGFRAMTGEKAHARQTAVYRLTGEERDVRP